MGQKQTRQDFHAGEGTACTRGQEEGRPSTKQRSTRGQRSKPQPEAAEPEPYCESESMWRGINFQGRTRSSDPKIHQEPKKSGLKNDGSMERVTGFKTDLDSSDERLNLLSSELLSGQQHLLRQDSKRQRLEKEFISYVQKELNRVWKVLFPDDIETPESDEEEKWRSIREEFLKITVHLLRNMEEEDLAKHLWSSSQIAKCGLGLKKRLQKKFHRVSEGVAEAGNSVPLNQIFTELFITEGGTDQVNQEHELRHLEAAMRNQARAETVIRQEELFKGSSDRERPIRCLLTKGVAGIGKTILTQKLTLDWAENKAHQNFQLMFPFTFRELNMLKEKKLSLMELVLLFFPETKESQIGSYEGVEVLFILDGLDECRLPLDFNSPVLTDTAQSTSIGILLTNLIKGNLLPSARLWMTSRPAAANQLPPECVDMVTEVRGFTDLQKEEYFRKRFKYKEQTNIISHIRCTRSLYIMCHIPIFCWITSTVQEEMFKSRQTTKLPKTLTEMYIHFLVVQAKVKKLKYDAGAGPDGVWTAENRKMIESLGKLAFEQLRKEQFIFYESDLTECGIDIKAAALYSGVFTQIFREEAQLYQEKVFCFVHLSFQEFLAALHVHLTFTNYGVNILDPQEQSKVQCGLGEFYQTAVVQTLESPNGHLDLFLRFLLGFSQDTNQTLLRGLLSQTGGNSWTSKNSSQIIKKKLSEDVSAERTINLFHCLNELNDTSLVEEIQQRLSSGRLSRYMSPAQWSAVAFILLSSEDHLDVFDLNKYSASEDAFMRLLPVVRASNKVMLRSCGLSERSCPPLSSVLSSPSSSLTQLDLRDNLLLDSGVKLLCAGLASPHCQLEVLSLSGCLVSEKGCTSLVSALSSNPSHLRELDLSYNHPGVPGLVVLSAGLESPDWRLKTLRLRSCGLSERSCPPLSSVLSSPSSSLTQLDLRDNQLQDSGVKLLCSGLASPHCKLEILSLSGCLVSEKGCTSLASALSSNPSHLRELDLSYNHPGGPGLELLSAGLESTDWRLDTLRVDHSGEEMLRPGLLKYVCPLTLDPDTAHRHLLLSNNNRTVKHVTEAQKYPEYPQRFNKCEQLLCREVLTGRCYWEVERSGGVYISVTYRRNSGEEERVFGLNDESWSLSCTDGSYCVRHNGTETKIRSRSASKRVGVFVDCPVGSVSFYSVSSNGLIHIHTFFTSFTRPLYPGFNLWDSSVTLCDPIQSLAM